MDWVNLFPQDKQPTMEDIASYIGEGNELWQRLLDYFSATYNAQPKLSFSGCSGKPGWNVKLAKSGQSFGTIYPEEGSFTIFMVMSYKLNEQMALLLPSLTPRISDMYTQAGDYMKLGKWMMFNVSDAATLEDYFKICSVKLAPKTAI